jgi:lipopolysaccharide transport system ATP-binding protein
MADAVIQVENVTKSYIISHETGGDANSNFRELISAKAKKLFSFSKPAETVKKEKFMALNDVSFNIAQGSRVGIIGSNGAGKSTLLKILSKIVEPTSGRVNVTGRVVSLLEVGTGFHPELTGRENIFLNGVILGMSRAEVRKKFDEIVDFSEIEKFLDTPVKRYSSGMYMRLAFAVAAHLEPEILIIDEVLAVGDAQFQKKCLAKMEEISRGDGRTVLFVSHNLDAIRKFCNQGIYLNSGKLVMQGDIDSVADKYASYFNERLTRFVPNSHKPIFFNDLTLNKKSIIFNDDIIIKCEIVSNAAHDFYIIGITLADVSGNKVASTLLTNKYPLKRGTNHIDIKIPTLNMVPGDYKFTIAIALDEALNNEDVVWDYPGFSILSDMGEHHSIFSKWHHSWGATLLAGAEFLTESQIKAE